MQFEVEQKHRIDDVAQFERQLAARGVSIGQPIEQVDQYFAHPSRDFAKTDEALRIRTVGDKSFVTYKGPKLDTTTKTRHELEMPIDADHRSFAELLEALGFKPVATVRKKRRPFQVAHAGRSIEGAVDEVDSLGTFVELELTADDTGLDEAKRLISALAAEFQLGPSERRSYLEMLLEKASPRGN
jgi:adenylate cyclase, class 2